MTNNIEEAEEIIIEKEDVKRNKSIVVRKQEADKGRETCKPHIKHCLLSRLLHSDISSLLNLATKRQVQVSDLFMPPSTTEECTKEFENAWAEEQSRAKKPKIRRAMMKTVKGLIIPGLLIQFLAILFQFCGPILINQVLKLILYKQRGLCDLPVFPSHLRGPFPPLLDFGSEEYLCKDNAPVVLSIVLFLILVAGALCQNTGQFLFQHAALNVRGAMIGSVYKKVLRLSSLGLSKTGAGMINNVAANDTENLLVSSPILSLVLFAPFQIGFIFVLLGYTVGATFLVGIAVIIIVLILAGFTGSKAFKYKLIQMKWGDARIKLTNELLAASRIVKAYGWEQPFEDEVMKLRNPEAHTIRMQALFFSCIGIVIIVAPVYLAVATFSTYSALGNELSPEVIFTALSVLNIMRFPLAFLPFGILEIIKITVSFQRLQQLLTAPELETTGRSLSKVEDIDAQKALAQAVTIEESEFGYHYEPPDDGKGKGKGKGKKCCGCLGKMFKGKGKGKGKGKDDGKGKGKGFVVDESRLIDVTMASGDVVKMARSLTVKSFQPTPCGLTMVVGPVGSGKTTLLTALLGELETIKGTRVDITAPVAYAAQVPWIINDTVEGNIKFGELDYGQEWYDTVLDKCCLRTDLEVLPGGDQTEIGERGVNLSGGQKARIALARAVYSKSKIFLFDDPLAAVDPHVGKQLFNGICGPAGVLAGTTRVLVTHQVQFMPAADQIVVIQDGNVMACGTYDELSTKGIVLEQFIRQDSGKSESDEKGQTESIQDQKQKDEKEENDFNRRKTVLPNEDALKDGELTKKESSREGRVSFSTYKTIFAKYWGLPVFFTWAFFLLLCAACRVGTDLWLAAWVGEGDPWGFSKEACILMYAGLAMAQGFLVFLRISTASVIGWIRACRRIYVDLLRGVFGSPTVFFDTTPSGRILNRFTADMDIMDSQLQRQFTQTSACFETVLTVLSAIIISEPLVGLVILPGIVFYGLLANYYRHIARDIQRLEGVTKTPIFSRIVETLAGVSTARAFGYQEYLIQESLLDINNNQATNWIKIKSGTWLSVRLEVMSCLITTACALFPTLFKVDDSNAALVGVALTYGLELSRFIQALTKFGAQLEQQFTSIERILDYCRLPGEAPPKMPDDAALPAKWPPTGTIEYKDVTMRYRAGLEPALRGLSFSLAGGEKLGVVGRTGSGKSSITVSLLRLTECEQGQIIIDGVNIQNIGLQKLRQSLSLIPQDPVLFGNMTLRGNLDPFNQYSDEQLNGALKQTQMDTKEALKEGLATQVSEGGSSFSVGERQLLCLARAMLRGSKITLLDEATASVDNETDDLIQRNIRESFKDSTVLCIAHRIRTILDSDKILVMNTGVCEEFGPPQELLRKPQSYFRESCAKSGIEVPRLEEKLDSL